MTKTRLSLQLLASIVLAMSGNFSVWANDANYVLKVVTEEYVPFNFTEHGKVTGFSTEVLESVLKEAGMQGQFQVLPWARAYEVALNAENVLIYSIYRTTQREKFFKWIGPLTTGEWFLYGLRDRQFKIETLDDAKKFKVGSVNEDAAEHYLLGKGFVKGGNLQSSVKYPLLYEKLKLGRLDLIILSESSVLEIARRAGDDANKTIQPVFRIGEQAHQGLYFALSAKSDEAILQRLRKALETLKKNGSFDAIKKKWAVQ